MKYKMEELSIEITYACPMDCVHCSSRAGAKNDILIHKKKIIEMIDKCVKNCGTTEVSFSGGEPFEHPDFWELLEYSRKKGLRTIVYSCGIQWNKNKNTYNSYSHIRLRRLKNLCDVLIISLQGTPHIHNKIMNIGDKAFEYATDTIYKSICYDINVEIHFVPTKLNYKDVLIVYGFCLILQVSKMSILRYVPQGRGLEHEKEGIELNLSKVEFMELNRQMRYAKEISKNLKTQFRIGIPADFTFLFEYFEGNKKAQKEKACTGGKTKILVKADGFVQVCPAWKELDHLSAGNIYKEDIVDIWQKGNTYKKFREFTWKDLDEPCFSCDLLESCIGGCGAQRILNNTMDIDGLRSAPDPLCFMDLLKKKDTKNYEE